MSKRAAKVKKSSPKTDTIRAMREKNAEKKEAKAKKVRSPKVKKEKVAKVRPVDPRLPEAGTVIEKKDRAGVVRCFCTVQEGGQVLYKGATYKSLTAAAWAACENLGIAKARNGWTFWGLVKPPRPAGDPKETFEKAWARFTETINRIAPTADQKLRDAWHTTIYEYQLPAVVV